MSAELTMPGGRRRSGRLRGELAASFDTLSGKLRLGIVDLSQAGARLRPHSEVKVGTQGVLRWLDFEAFGEVAWKRKGFIGLKFDKPIRPTQLHETRKAIELGEAPREDDWEERLVRQWYQGKR
ncbi:hypothetical protein [Aurantiacibacter hainanensis]|uniref:hypothetical protein n=1 Tax=Aurantiacibacter hainanensis TaxID=3076114 RepID=UPI0030C6796E